MPIPKPKKVEHKQDYIKRFIKNSIMEKEYPNIKQRLAIAYTQLRRRV